MARSIANQAPNNESHPIHQIQELPGSALKSVSQALMPDRVTEKAWRRECPLIVQNSRLISNKYVFARVRSHKLTRELTPDFSGQERTPALFLVARARRPQWSARARIRCVFGQRQVRSVCCNSTIKAKANLRPSGYERATLPEKVSNYWHSHARSGTSVRV